MNEEKLIQQLEDASLPQIEIVSHRNRLRADLLNNYSKARRSGLMFAVCRKAALPVIVLVILFGLGFNNLILPRYNLAQAVAIAQKDPQVQEWLKQGAYIKEKRIIDNKVYILLQPAKVNRGEEATLSGKETDRQEESDQFLGALVEVEITEKRVSRIENAAPMVKSFMDSEEERIKEIMKNTPEAEKIIPNEAEILEIKISLPELEIKQNHSVKIMPEAVEEAHVIYYYDDEQKTAEMNVSESKMEYIEYLPKSGE